MKKEINMMIDKMINITEMKEEINMKKTEIDHTEKEAEKRIQDIEDIAMKEVIIDLEGTIETNIETKEKI